MWIPVPISSAFLKSRGSFRSYRYSYRLPTIIKVFDKVTDKINKCVSVRFVGCSTNCFFFIVLYTN